MHDIFSDLRIAFRQLARAPGFATAALVVLALSIGLNAGVVGLGYMLAFAGRPFAAPNEVVQLYSRHAVEPNSYRAFSHSAYEMIASRHDVFAAVAAHNLGMVGVRESAGAGDPRRTFAAFVSQNYFQMLGVPWPGAGASRLRRNTRRRRARGHRLARAVAPHWAATPRWSAAPSR